jgi:hypothetical protein
LIYLVGYGSIDGTSGDAVQPKQRRQLSFVAGRFEKTGFEPDGAPCPRQLLNFESKDT